MKELILAWLLAQPVSKYDAAEAPDARESRLSTVAEAVTRVANGDRLKAAFLLVQAKHESSFRYDVQTCACPPNQCDGGRAHSLWQLHRVPAFPIETWHGYCGVEFEAVYSAASRSAWSYDPVRLERSFAMLGGATTPLDSRWVLTRAAEARKLARKL